MQQDKIDIKSWNLTELKEFFISIGEKPFRAKQVYEWIHVRLVETFDEMSNLSKALRETLKERCELVTLRVVREQKSELDETTKYLWELPDHNIIESVKMQYQHGNSVCISSQVGCRMGCEFCASTLDGLERSLKPSEMLEQVYQIQKRTKERVSHVVVMGTGEPMDNYENLLKFLRILTDENGLHISQRNITVSTCGIVPAMRKFAKEELSVTLALSLHAPNDAIRKKLMPIANAYAMDEVLEACEYYFKKTGRRVTFEYSLVSGINDRKEDAEELASKIRHKNCHVNLIPVNPIKERNYEQSRKKEISNFKNTLEKYGINVTIRREMGRDIDGACGQLRKSYQNEHDNQCKSQRT